MSQLKKRSREGLGLGGLLWKNFSFANLRSANFRFAKFGARLITLAALSLSLTLAGCDTGGGGGGGGDSSGNGGGTPTCTGSEILKNDQCEACPDSQFPNADRTACVTNCPDGQIRLANNPTCEIQVTCTGRQIFNPTDNSCFELSCDEGKIPDTTVTPAACIEENTCRTSPGKLLSADGRSCISESGCLAVSNQLINERGDCEACTGDAPVRNVEKNACISEAACQGTSVGPNSLLGTDCITDETCQNMAGHVATSDGECQECTGENSIRNMEKTACMSAQDCQSLSDNAFSVLDGADCITDAACNAMTGHVATTDGVCMECGGNKPVSSVDKSECITAEACQSDSSLSLLDGAECITDAACMELAGHVAATDGVCMECGGDKPVRDVDKTACTTATVCHGGVSTNPNSILGDDCITDIACIEMPSHVAQYDGVCQQCTGDTPDRNAARTACGVDSDSDGVIDSDDPFPADACASVDSDGDDFPDSLVDDCATTLSADVDDDNDGLIELATYEQLQNMRHDLAGHSYNDGDTASTAGAPEEATDNCPEETSAGSSIFLCGYELAANIDANASCPNYDGSNGADLTAGDSDDDNADDCGAGQDAWAPVGDCGTDGQCGGTNAADDNPFTGILEGNGHSISNLYYRRVVEEHLVAGLFGHTSGAAIQRLSLSNVYISASSTSIRSLFRVGGIVGAMEGGNITSSSVDGQFDTDRINDCTGGLVGRIFGNNASISNSYATGSVKSSGSSGGLVACIIGNNTSISNSYATGSNLAVIAGGLVGVISATTSISNSYATGNATSNNATGSLVGEANFTSISNSYATGNATSYNTFAGGLVGQLAGGSSIQNSYATGSATGVSTAGGLVGRLDASRISNSYATGNAEAKGASYAGGLVGSMSASIISNSYAAGSASIKNPTGTNASGGLIGNFGGHIFGKNYYVASAGTNGIGDGTCDAAICIRAGAAGNTDAQRRTWLQTTADESTVGIFPTDATGNDHDDDSNTPNITWEVWDSSIWGSFTSGYPCLKNMPSGARVCN